MIFQAKEAAARSHSPRAPILLSPRPRVEVSPGTTVDELVLGEEMALAPIPVRISWIHVHPGHTSPVDVHQVREVWLVASGNGVLRCGEARVFLSAGETFFFDSGVPHAVFNDGSEVLTLVSLWWSP